MRRGKFFISLTAREDRKAAVWDPYRYAQNETGQVLGDLVLVQNLSRKGSRQVVNRLEPLEYRHLPSGGYLSFSLLPLSGEQHSLGYVAYVGEGELLFGTMRAYLANVVVTPRAEWIGLPAPVHYPVKAEFVRIRPHDGLVYYWWAYLRSSHFIQHLPPGSGGTRPRVQVKDLVGVPVMVPPQATRQAIDTSLRECAQAEWALIAQKQAALNMLASVLADQGDGR
jgi:hypothetical protein